MHHYTVDSSHLSSVAWEDGVLEVKFRNGHVYQYEEVPEQLYADLVNATSPGKFFTKHVRGRYEHRKM